MVNTGEGGFIFPVLKSFLYRKQRARISPYVGKRERLRRGRIFCRKKRRHQGLAYYSPWKGKGDHVCQGRRTRKTAREANKETKGKRGTLKNQEKRENKFLTW